MAAALEMEKIADQEFAAPDLAVRSVARAIERHADHGALDAVIRHATRDVRMMVLHADGEAGRIPPAQNACSR